MCKTESKTSNDKKTFGLSDFPTFRLSDSILKASLKRYHLNNLVTFLVNLFGEEVTQQLICKYLIGTAKHWPGATVFWQIDIDKKVRAGKIMLYDAVTGKRVKQLFNHIAWVHKVLPVAGTHATPNAQPATSYQLNQCFFGEHLLAGNDMPIAIVESEKTALIASVYLPAYLWLATGGLSNLTLQKCSVLKGRKVFLFPDINGYKAWAAKLATFGSSKIWLYDMLELKAIVTEKQEGFDIADYLMSGNPW